MWVGTPLTKYLVVNEEDRTSYEHKDTNKNTTSHVCSSSTFNLNHWPWDTQNFSGTEEPLIKVKWNESEEYLGGSGNTLEIMEIVQLSIAPVGITGNLTVIVVFLNHRKLRRKIPNRFIVNQVGNSIFIFIT